MADRQRDVNTTMEFTKSETQGTAITFLIRYTHICAYINIFGMLSRCPTSLYLGFLYERIPNY